MSKSPMMVIGLTGPSGAGKGTIAAMFERAGIYSIDTDAVYHKLLLPPSACLTELHSHFGDCILCADGTLNRKALSAIVFNPADGGRELSVLNAIAHHHISLRTDEILAVFRAAGCPAALIDAPLLFESGFNKKCDKILTVLADRDIRKARILARDAISEQEADARLNSQKPDDYYKNHADWVIYNNGSPEDCRPLVTAIIDQITKQI